MERINKVFIVGTLVETSIEEKEKNEIKYIAGSFKVEVEDNNIIEVKLFANELTKQGKVNKKYQSYRSIPQMEGKRVKVSGEISMRAFYSAPKGQVITFNEITLGFINLAEEKDANKATFEYSGFVTKAFADRYNKEEVLVTHEIEVGQPNYNGESLVNVRFSVDPEDRGVASSIQANYTVGKSVVFDGQIMYLTTVNTVTSESDFGDPITKEFTNVIKLFLIKSGKVPVIDGAYTEEEIKKLNLAYANYLSDVENKQKEEVKSGASVNGTQKAKSTADRFGKLL